jgi:hypothetical protein
MKPISEYTSVGEWKDDVEQDGYITGTQVCRGISTTMSKNKMTFAEAYEYLMKSGKLFLVGKNFVIDVSVTHS